MCKTLLASAAVLGMALATPALSPARAQDSSATPPAATGATMPRPMHTQASNIGPSDTRSVIAPRLPEPNLSMNASPAQFLQAAQQDVRQHRGGAAEAALGDAETRLLNRSVAPSAASEPDRSPAVQDIEQARDALAHHDWQSADQHIAAALQHAQMAESGNGTMMPPGQTSAMPPMSGSGPAVGSSGMDRTPPAAMAPPNGGMTAGTHSVPMGGVLPPNGGVMTPNGGVMAPNVPSQ